LFSNRRTEASRGLRWRAAATPTDRPTTACVARPKGGGGSGGGGGRGRRVGDSDGRRGERVKQHALLDMMVALGSGKPKKKERLDSEKKTKKNFFLS